MVAKVLLTTEGTYPYSHGGVSVWCDQLIRRLGRYRFHVFAIVASPRHPARFELPGNVVSCRPFPLWGTSMPGLQHARLSTAFLRSLRTGEKVIVDRFLPDFRTLLRCILVRGAPVEPLGHALVALQVYFEEFDYPTTMHSEMAWTAFLEASRLWLGEDRQLNLEEATACMRWLVRYLGILTVPQPATDLVHASMTGLAGVPGVLAKLRHGTPYLVTEHGIYLRELYLALSRMDYSLNCRHFLLSLNDAVVRMNYHFADQVTSLGEFNRAWQLRLGADPAKMVFVANGVEPSRFAPAPERRPARPTVLTLARIFALKGIDVLLEAAAMVRDQVPEVVFRILGESADPGYMEHCLGIVGERRLEGNVEWGETRDPAAALVAAHVFCLPSISEGMPYCILEAMLSGCPVVATDVGNVGSVLAGTGILVPPKDPASLAGALVRLLRDPGAEALRERLAASALDRVHRHYTLDVCARKFDGLYGELSSCKTTFQTV